MCIKLNRFVKTTLLLVLMGTLTACAGGYHNYLNQPAVPIGSQVELNISANVALDQNRIYIQNRMLVSKAQIDQYQIFCTIVMHRYQETTQPQLKIVPGKFTVTRVRLVNDFIHRPVIYANNDDQYYSPSHGVDFRTELHLTSNDQPEVSALTCTDHRPKYKHKNEYLGRSDFEAALGNFVTLP
jgi:hypothetical protein